MPHDPSRTKKLIAELQELVGARADQSFIVDSVFDLHSSIKNLTLTIGLEAALLLVLGFGGRTVTIPTAQDFGELLLDIEAAKMLVDGKHEGWVKLKVGADRFARAVEVREKVAQLKKVRDDLGTYLSNASKQ